MLKKLFLEERLFNISLLTCFCLLTKLAATIMKFSVIRSSAFGEENFLRLLEFSTNLLVDPYQLLLYLVASQNYFLNFAHQFSFLQKRSLRKLSIFLTVSIFSGAGICVKIASFRSPRG